MSDNEDLGTCVFLADLYDSFIEANRNPNPEKRMLKLKRLLHELPDHHYETFKHLAEHLSVVAAHGHTNKVRTVHHFETVTPRWKTLTTYGGPSSKIGNDLCLTRAKLVLFQGGPRETAERLGGGYMGLSNGAIWVGTGNLKQVQPVYIVALLIFSVVFVFDPFRKLIDLYSLVLISMGYIGLCLSFLSFFFLFSTLAAQHPRIKCALDWHYSPQTLNVPVWTRAAWIYGTA